MNPPEPKWWSAPGLGLNLFMAFAAAGLLFLLYQHESRRLDGVLHDVSELVANGITNLRSLQVSDTHRGSI